VRAGSRTLSLLSIPLNAVALKSLADGPTSLVDLRREADFPPQTTLRGYLRGLIETGVLERRRRSDFPGSVEYQLTDSGTDLISVAKVLSAWLATSPDGFTDLGGGGAKNAIQALVEGWSTSMVRALAARPLSLTELDSVIASVSYPSLERRLIAMRLAGLVEPTSPTGRCRPHTVTDWLRRSIAPIAAAARWEHRHLAASPPAVTNRDIETAFLLALPLLRVPKEISGTCRLTVDTGRGARDGLVGVTVEVRSGEVWACAIQLDGLPDAWALGSTAAWSSAIVHRDARRLELGGDSILATELVECLQDALLGAPARHGSP
jgi:DNA-binding HxlR family transcriptional regulator